MADESMGSGLGLYVMSLFPYEKLSIIQTVARSMSVPTEPADKR